MPSPPELLGFLREMEFSTLTQAHRRRAGRRGRRHRSSGRWARPCSRAGAGRHPPPPPSWRQAGARCARVPRPQAAVALATSAAKAQDRPLQVRDGDELRSSRRGSRRPAPPAAFAFDTETTSLDAMQAEFVGFSLALAPGKACYVPLGASRRQLVSTFGGSGAASSRSRSGRRWRC